MNMPKQTCPSIDKCITIIDDLLYIAPEENERNAKYWAKYAKELLEEIRDANSTLRNIAEEKIDEVQKLEDQIYVLEQQIQDYKYEIHQLQKELYEANYSLEHGRNEYAE